MPASEIRKDAREALRGKWGKAIAIVIIYFIITLALGFVEGLAKSFSSVLYTVTEIVVALVSVPIGFGIVVFFMKLKRDESVSVLDFLKEGFSHFAKAWEITLYTFLKLLLPFFCLFLVAILMIILLFFNMTANVSFGVHLTLTILAVAFYLVTIVYVVSRALLYVLAYNIAYDQPELSAKACVLKSEAYMKGNRGNYFLLELSFIGWSILAALSLGIGILWLLPYMQVAAICFYEKLAKTEPKKVEGSSKIEPEEVKE